MNNCPKPSRSVHANGERLRALRRETGLTQEELAGRTGYSARLIRKAELGKRIDLKTIRAFSHYFAGEGLDVKTTDLIEDETSVYERSLPDQWLKYVFR